MNDENTVLNHAVASNHPIFSIEGLGLKARTQIIWRRLTNTNIIQDSTQKKVDRNPRLSAFFSGAVWESGQNSKILFVLLHSSSAFNARPFPSGFFGGPIVKREKPTSGEGNSETGKKGK